MTERLEHMGLYIVPQQYNGTFDKSDTLGFTVPAAFTVVDDFDEPALPLVNHWHWSPHDAKNAIEFCAWWKEHVVTGKRWKDTASWAFQDVLAFRRHPHKVFAALQDIKTLLASAQDFDENPARAIEDRIYLLELELKKG